MQFENIELQALEQKDLLIRSQAGVRVTQSSIRLSHNHSSHFGEGHLRQGLISGDLTQWHSNIHFAKAPCE